jgi:hypothetical protein
VLKILLRSGQRLMESRAIGRIEPVARVKRQKLNLSTFGEVRRLVQHESTVVHAGFQSHTERIPRSPCRLGCDRSAAAALPPLRRLRTWARSPHRRIGKGGALPVEPSRGCAAGGRASGTCRSATTGARRTSGPTVSPWREDPPAHPQPLRAPDARRPPPWLISSSSRPPMATHRLLGRRGRGPPRRPAALRRRPGTQGPPRPRAADPRARGLAPPPTVTRAPSSSRTAYIAEILGGFRTGLSGFVAFMQYADCDKPKAKTSSYWKV